MNAHTSNGSNPSNSETTISAIAKHAQPPFAASLRGTERDGKLHIDENGNLLVARGIRDLFDYYLTTLGEHNLAVIHRQLRGLFDRELPPAAASQASALLDAYLQYRELSGKLQQHYPALDEKNAFAAVADYFAQRDALRNQLFEPDAVDAFFAADQINERDALPRLMYLADQNPSANDPVAGDLADPQDAYGKYRETISQRNAVDAATDDLDALRMQLFGREATDRLAALDQRRSDWKARLTSYQEQKQQLLVAAAEAGIDPSAQLNQLLQSQFNEREMLRVRALDKQQ